VSDIRVLIVDDSPTVCSIFKRGLSRAGGIEVVGTAPNPYVARDMIVKDPPDVVTLDIEMPRMDGLTFLRKLMKHFPLPVVVVSTLTSEGSQKAMDALAFGAVEVVEKNMAEDRVNDLMLEVVRKVRAAAGARVKRQSFSAQKKVEPVRGKALPKVSGSPDQILAIGASTGGTEALNQVITRLPADIPGTVIVQHMPPGFTTQMAQRLDRGSQATVREAKGGEYLEPGLILVAPGDRHLLVHRKGGRYQVELRDGPRVSRHKPSVDVLFKTVARAAGDNAVGVILTGMGRDGAEGMLAMKQAGAHNIAQDEESCVVYGMPREAVALGAHSEVVPLGRIAEKICRAFSRAHV
jgi:two-component system chemotaxis response regulator CheB